ncbi:MAG: BTAD domain-containing putative transcriptional regulator, partial [Acidimicrobiales bacterium]
VAALQRALSIDPYVEELARRTMAAQVDLGDRAGAARTYRRLEAALAELDVDPEPDTQRLAATLASGPGPRRKPGNGARPSAKPSGAGGHR